MKNLTSLCEFINNNKRHLNDFITNIDVCYLWNCNGTYKPKLNFWSFYGSIKKNYFPKIHDYNIWLTFFCDYIGYNVLIYYPKNPKKGELIKVIFKGLNIKGFINWEHGLNGLFFTMIFPLLFLDKLNNIIKVMIIDKGLPNTEIILEKFERFQMTDILKGAKIYFEKLIDEKTNFECWEHTELENYFIDFIDELIDELN